MIPLFNLIDVRFKQPSRRWQRWVRKCGGVLIPEIALVIKNQHPCRVAKAYNAIAAASVACHPWRDTAVTEIPVLFLFLVAYYLRFRWHEIGAGAEVGRACQRADPWGSDGCLGGAREGAALGLRLPRCIDACARLPREGRPHGEAGCRTTLCSAVGSGASNGLATKGRTYALFSLHSSRASTGNPNQAISKGSRVAGRCRAQHRLTVSLLLSVDPRADMHSSSLIPAVRPIEHIIKYRSQS